MTKEPLTDPQQWQAVTAHDARADGHFWYGVRTTGVYCRPSCPSRRPNRENVVFFSSPPEAEHAGFRPCRRCLPHQVSVAARAVARTQALLEEAETEPTLAELARQVGLSPFHLQRIFKAHVGVSPKQYAMNRRTAKFKRRLREGQKVTTALYDAGHNSPGTLYARTTDQLGMKPRQYAHGGAALKIAHDVMPTPLGNLLIAATPRGLCSVQFGEPAALLEGLRLEFPNAALVHDPGAVAEYRRALERYFSDPGAVTHLPSDPHGTAFQQRVWAQLRAIPQGETRSYAEIASAIGSPKAVRAVAQACAANPVGVVIPCHRVIRAGGSLSGYRWGVERKETLLHLEQAGRVPRTAGEVPAP